MPFLPSNTYRKTRGIIRRDIRANQPSATTVLEGTLYYVTDEFITERSNGTIWESYSDLPDHDHTSTPGDGGVLTNDEHDGYSDYIKISDSGTPDIDHERLWVNEFHGFNFFTARGSDDRDLILSRDNVIVVSNETGFTIPKGSAVYFNGNITGNVPEIDLALADSESTMPAVGLAFEDIDDGKFGRAIVLGILNFDTSAFMDGDLLYISPLIPGELTEVQPTIPNLIQRIGIVAIAGPGNSGRVLVTQTGIKFTSINYAVIATRVAMRI
jgi:hypothetical protein